MGKQENDFLAESILPLASKRLSLGIGSKYANYRNFRRTARL
jgi:hypothetical protein